MKRIISLCCVCLILVMSLAVPARAADFSNFIDALDYGFPNDGSSTYVSVSSNTEDVRFNIPLNIVYYVDIVAVVTGITPSSVWFLPSGYSEYSTSLNMEYIGNDLWRFYGHCNPALGSEYFTLRFDSSQVYINFKSVRFLSSPFGDYKVGVEGVGTFPGGNFDISKDWGDSRPTTQTITHSGSSYDDREFYLYLQPKYWKKYDFIEYQLSLMVADITSVSCVMGNTNIPIDVSYTQFSNADSSYYLTLSFDVSNLDRSSNDFPMVIIEGHVVFDGVSSVSLTNSKGFVNLGSGSDLLIFFGNLKSFFVTQYNSLHSWIQSQTASLQTEIQDLVISISMEFTNLKSNINSHFNNLDSWISSQTNSILLAFANYFSLLDQWIINQTNSINDTIYQYFSRLNQWILDQTSTLESAIRGDTDPGDDFQDQVDQKDQQMDDMAAVMDSVTKPAIQDINVSVDQYIDPADVQVLVTPLTVFFEADLFRTMIIMSILLATVSYTLYGKR